ncbi:diaminopimelate decarboxylase, partial [Enterococcus faecium]
FSLENDLLHIVAENLMEVELFAELSQRYLKKICIMLRLIVGVEAHTHELIVTAHIDSKFAMSYESKECHQALLLIKESSYLELEGF